MRRCFPSDKKGGFSMDKNKLKSYAEKFDKELYSSVEPFWTKYGMDKTYGGMTTCLDRFGEIYSADKSVWMQGRAAYMYSVLACDGRNKELYIENAKSCLDFLDRYCIDTDGRMFFTVTEDGRPLRKRRYRFSETFYIIANAIYYAAAGDESRLEIAKKYYDFVMGMYTGEREDPYKITPKTIETTRMCRSLADPMILLNVTQIMRSADPERTDVYNSYAERLIKDITNYHYRPQSGLLMETVGMNGETDDKVSSYRVVNPGHSLEACWFLLTEAERTGDTELSDKAVKIYDAAMNIGWDKEYGGIFYFKDYLGKPVEAYEHDMKLWWPHNEAVIASLMLYKKTGDEKYMKNFETLVSYAFSAFSDPEYGEWFGYLRRDGKPTEPPCKGHTYKGFFHVARMLHNGMKILKELI